MFHHCCDEVYVDEKWFSISKVNARCHSVPDERKPHWTCKHESHIPKIMFCCEVARPQFDANGNCEFDGKTGIWPFIKKKATEKNSKNQPASGIQTNPFDVTAPVINDMMINKLIPAARAK